jgi:hypothetical protein
VKFTRTKSLVATSDNPLDHPEQFKQVGFVMKGGRVYRRHGLDTVPPQN